MSDIVLVPLDAKIYRCPIDRVMVTTIEDLVRATKRIDAIAEQTGADPQKLAAIMLADVLAASPASVTALHPIEQQATIEDDDIGPMTDGRRITRVGHDGIERTELLQSFEHPDNGLQCPCGAGGFETVAAMLAHRQARDKAGTLCRAFMKANRIPSAIQEKEFEKGQVL